MESIFADFLCADGGVGKIWGPLRYQEQDGDPQPSHCANKPRMQPADELVVSRFANMCGPGDSVTPDSLCT